MLQLSQHLREGIEGHYGQAEIAQPLRQQTCPRSDVEHGLAVDGSVAKQVPGAPLNVVLDDMRREDRVIDPGNGIEIRLFLGAGVAVITRTPSRLASPMDRPASPSS